MFNSSRWATVQCTAPEEGQLPSGVRGPETRSSAYQSVSHPSERLLARAQDVQLVRESSSRFGKTLDRKHIFADLLAIGPPSRIVPHIRDVPQCVRQHELVEQSTADHEAWCLIVSSVIHIGHHHAESYLMTIRMGMQHATPCQHRMRRFLRERSRILGRFLLVSRVLTSAFCFVCAMRRPTHARCVASITILKSTYHAMSQSLSPLSGVTQVIGINTHNKLRLSRRSRGCA